MSGPVTELSGYIPDFRFDLYDLTRFPDGEIKDEMRGQIMGLIDAIELGMTLRFPDQIAVVMAEVKKINSLDVLIKIKDAIKTAKSVSDIQQLIKGL